MCIQQNLYMLHIQRYNLNILYHISKFQYHSYLSMFLDRVPNQLNKLNIYQFHFHYKYRRSSNKVNKTQKLNLHSFRNRIIKHIFSLKRGRGQKYIWSKSIRHCMLCKQSRMINNFHHSNICRQHILSSKQQPLITILHCIIHINLLKVLHIYSKQHCNLCRIQQCYHHMFHQCIYLCMNFFINISQEGMES